MKYSSTYVLARRQKINNIFNTEPCECGWASEAIFFIRIHESINTILKAKVQISVDGINWIDKGCEFNEISTIGDNFLCVSHFGGWLRLEIQSEGADSVIATIHLALKE